MKDSSRILAKQYKRFSLLPRVLMTISVIAGIIPVFIIMRIIQLLTNDKVNKESIILMGAVISLCLIVKAVFYGLSTWKSHQYAYSLLSKIRLDMISHLKKLPLVFFQKRKIGDLTNIIHHDVDQIELYLAHGLPDITIATLIPILILISLFVIDWRLGLALISTVPLVLFYQMILNKLIADKFIHYAESTKRMSEDLLEYIATIPVIKAFSKEEKRTERVLKGMDNYLSWVGKTTVGISFPMVLSTMLMECGFVVLVIVSSLLLRNQQIDMPVFVLSIILGGLFGASFAQFPTFHHFGIIFKNAVKSIYSVMGVQTSHENKSRVSTGNGDIEYKSVNFSYEGDKKVLEDVNLIFKKNTVNAIVGASGSGKSTIANLLMGFWQPNTGTITVGNTDINKIGEQDLTNLVSIVQQEVFLFNMSIEENIKIGNKDASREQVIIAAKKAQIHDRIMTLPEGYDTLVGESGAKLSGGEKQRISIARMMLKNTPIVILDEATSAIDASNEYLIQKAIDQLGKNKTIITIAHHINTIQKADQIIVMDSGRILEKGTHEELFAKCNLYKTMVEEQENVDNWEIKEVVS